MSIWHCLKRNRYNQEHQADRMAEERTAHRPGGPLQGAGRRCPEELHEAVGDVLSNMILISYLLGKRLGISYNAVEMKIHKKIRLGLVENNDVEKYYGDMSELSKHLGSNRRKEK